MAIELFSKKPTAVICLSPYSGGMELDAISFAKKLLPYTKTVLIVQENKFMHEKLKNDSMNYETISFFKTFSLSIIINARRIIKKYGIKNVIFFGASELKSLYFSFLGLDINLIIRHSTTKSRPKKDWFHRLIYSDVNYNISTSKHLENNVKYIIPFGKRTQSQMIYSSFEFSEPQYKEHDCITLVHTGRIADAKGQIDAIKASKILEDNNIDFKLYIVGGYDESYKGKFLREYEGYKPAPYFANRGMKWIQQFDSSKEMDENLAYYLTESHRLVSLGLTKIKQKELDKMDDLGSLKNDATLDFDFNFPPNQELICKLVSKSFTLIFLIPTLAM